MVRFHYGNRFAELALITGPEPWLTLDGKLHTRREIYGGVQEVLSILSRIWLCEEEDIGNDFSPPSELRFEDQLNLAMMHGGEIFYTRQDGLLRYFAAVENYHDIAVEGYGVPRYLPELHREYSRAEWRTTARSPYNQKLFEAVRAKFPDLSIKSGVDAQAHIASWLNHKMRQPSVHVIHIERDHVGRISAIRLSDVREQILHPWDMPAVKKAQGELRQILTSIILEEWNSFFPPDTDVIEVDALKFRFHTLAGLRPGENIGMESVPSTYAIPWESRHTVILMRLGREVRCPDQYRARVIGAKGAVITKIAQKAGWPFIKLV